MPFRERQKPSKMKKEELKEMTTEELRQKEKSTKYFLLLMVMLTISLLYFVLRNYFTGAEFDMPLFIIALCTLGGLLSLLPNWKAIRSELSSRNS
jgi:hypothetical protein